MLKFLDTLLKSLIVDGSLSLISARGQRYHYGSGTGSKVVVRLLDLRLERRLMWDPDLALAEGYMDGQLRLEQGRIFDLLELLAANAKKYRPSHWHAPLHYLRRFCRRLQQFNTPIRARRNAALHYDINGTLYDLFLDRDRQYSCAYFDAADADLEAAQLAKKRHLAAKLALAPGQQVLDIGSGWGGLALYLAKVDHCAVTGVTLSSEQLKVSARRATQAGLSRAVRFELLDYRKLKGRFDRIVSVGMFEHVGVSHYRTYFAKLRELLTDDGVAVVHSIGRSEPPGATNPFLAKYIFPGGYIPALSEMSAAIERSGLIISDVEVLRLHYAETLRCWRRRFLAHWAQAADLLGDRFCRMWEFYLAAAEIAFRYQNFVVFQVQLIKRIDALPITRAYMPDLEVELRAQEATANPWIAASA
jgi:cyclopropane-fatty-acyl-phospholipid synthase